MMKIKFYLTIIIVALIMFFNLGSVPLLDPDEPVYAQTAREMIDSGDFISPRIYGEYWYDKPPMYYWLTVISFKLFGISDFSARFPSALLAVGGAVAVYLFCSKLFNIKTAFFSAVILTTSIEYFYLGKAAVTDMTLTFCLTVALLSFLAKRYCLFYFFTGLAVLTKGPVGFFFPVVIVGIYLVITKQLHVLRQMKLFRGLILFSAVALPWYIIMYKIHGQVFIDTFLGFHNITRFTSPEHKLGAAWYYFIPVLLIGFFPWTAVLPQAVRNSLTKSKSGQRNTLIFLNIWAAAIFLFFTLSQTKLVSYILPMYPPIAILAGWYVGNLSDNYGIGLWKWSTLTVVFSGIVLAAMMYSAQTFPELVPVIISTSIVLIIMTVFCLNSLWMWQADGIFWTKTLAMGLFFLIQIMITAPIIAPSFTSKYAAEEFLKVYDGQCPVYVTKFLRPGFAFYSGIYGRQIAISPGEPAQLARAINEPDKGYFIVGHSDYDRLSADVKEAVVVVAETKNVMVLKEK